MSRLYPSFFRYERRWHELAKFQYLEFEKCKAYKTIPQGCKWIILQSKRGIGKTWAIHIWLIKEFIEKGYPFIKITRNTMSIKPLSAAFSGGPFDLYFSEKYYTKIETVGIFKFIYLCVKQDEDDAPEVILHNRPMGVFVSLSGANHLKEYSTAFSFIDSETKKQIPLRYYMDEFQVEKGSSYLVNEIDQLLSVFSTINREREGSLMIFTSNSVSILCPLFTALGIDRLLAQSPNLKFYYDKAHQWCLQRFDNSDFRGMEGSEYMKAFSNASYLKMASDNVFQDSLNMIKNLDSCTYERKMVFIGSDDKVYTIDFIPELGLWYVSDRGRESDTKNYVTIASSINAHKLGTLYDASDGYILRLRNLFQQGEVLFKNLQSKEKFIELIGYYNRK